MIDVKSAPAVLQLVYSLARGGRREAVATLVRKLGAQGKRCAVACTRELGCERHELEGWGVPIHDLSNRSAMDRGAARRLRETCERERIDVIHCHDAASQFLAARLRSVWPRFALLMTFHRSLPIESARWIDRARNAFANRQCGAIVVGSRERREHFLRVNLVARRKVVRIPFGTELSRFRPDEATREEVRRELGIGPGMILIGAVGHFGAEKGIDVAIRGFQALSGRSGLPPLALAIAGEGDAATGRAMRDLAASRPAPGPIHFLGFRDDVHRWFRGFDVLAHVPRLEAFGLVTIEAMACELPVVASRVGGLTDIVRDGRNGRLVAPESPEQLADALARLALDPVNRQRLGAEARRVALAEYDAELYASRHASLYRDLIAGSAPRGVDEDDAGVSAVADRPAGQDSPREIHTLQEVRP